jgi:NADP-dependent 3-hydroxy acid dehydrogenase YdfG
MPAKTVLLISGATHVIGKAFALHFVKTLEEGSVIIVTSRSQDRLNELKAEMKALNPKVEVVDAAMELNCPEKSYFEKRMFASPLTSGPFDRSVIVHNAFQIGSFDKRVAQFDDVPVLQESFSVNVASMLAINSLFHHKYASAAQRFVVGMTAPSAVRPIPSFGIASIGMASRKMLLNIYAAEEPLVKVLHFDPIAVDSQSLRSIRDNSGDGIRQKIQSSYDSEGNLTGEQVAQQLEKLIMENTFTSGDTFNAKGAKL